MSWACAEIRSRGPKSYDSRLSIFSQLLTGFSYISGYTRAERTARQSQGYDAPIGRSSNSDRISLQNSPLSLFADVLLSRLTWSSLVLAVACLCHCTAA